MPSTLLVTGASGQLGRLVIEHLLARHDGAIVATTRTPSALADLSAKGVDVRAADFDDPDSLQTAFAGADRMLLISTASLEKPGVRLTQQRAAVDAAVRANIRHIVYTSAPVPRPLDGGGLIDDHFWTEQAIAASGLDFSFMRHNLYSDLLLMSLPHAASSGKLFNATRGGRRAYVSREDCARADAEALMRATGKQLFDISGPAAITQDELAVIASEIVGTSIAHVDVPPAGLREGLIGAGLPEPLVDGLVDFDIDASIGRHALVTDAVEALTGTPPTSVHDFLQQHRETLRAAS